MCRDPWFLKFTKAYIVSGHNRNPSIPELDKRPRFWNLFCRIWSQNQDLGLKLAASILTRRGAFIGTHFDPHSTTDMTQKGVRISRVGLQMSLWCCLISSLNRGLSCSLQYQWDCDRFVHIRMNLGAEWARRNLDL